MGKTVGSTNGFRIERARPRIERARPGICQYLRLNVGFEGALSTFDAL